MCPAPFLRSKYRLIQKWLEPRLTFRNTPLVYWVLRCADPTYCTYLWPPKHCGSFTNTWSVCVFPNNLHATSGLPRASNSKADPLGTPFSHIPPGFWVPCQVPRPCKHSTSLSEALEGICLISRDIRHCAWLDCPMQEAAWDWKELPLELWRKFRRGSWHMIFSCTEGCGEVLQLPMTQVRLQRVPCSVGNDFTTRA